MAPDSQGWSQATDVWTFQGQTQEQLAEAALLSWSYGQCSVTTVHELRATSLWERVQILGLGLTSVPIVSVLRPPLRTESRHNQPPALSDPCLAKAEVTSPCHVPAVASSQHSSPGTKHLKPMATCPAWYSSRLSVEEALTGVCLECTLARS